MWIVYMLQVSSSIPQVRCYYNIVQIPEMLHTLWRQYVVRCSCVVLVQLLKANEQLLRHNTCMQHAVCIMHAERDAFGSHELQQTHYVHLLTELYFYNKRRVINTTIMTKGVVQVQWNLCVYGAHLQSIRFGGKRCFTAGSRYNIWVRILRRYWDGIFYTKYNYHFYRQALHVYTYTICGRCTYINCS